MISHKISHIFQSQRSEAVRSAAHFYFLDALRGLAALWVVLYHVGDERIPTIAKTLPPWIYTPLFHWGSLGVAIFFVLSGFVIAHSLRNTKLTTAYVQNFTLRRLVRLSPPYYASILFCLGFAAFAAKAKGLDFDLPSLPQLLAHLTYSQDLLGFKHINDVYWTLCLELQFYLSFCLLLWISQKLEHKSRPTSKIPTQPQGSNKGSNLSNLLWIGTAACSLIWPLFIEQTTRPTYFLPHWHGFLLGVFAHWAWQKRIQSHHFYAYATLLLAGAALHQEIFTAGCVLSAIGLLLAGQRQTLSQWLNAPIFQFLGKISYSLYLTHAPILGAVLFIGTKVLGKSLGQSIGSELLLLTLGISISIAISAGFWWAMERPSIAWSQQLKATNQ